MYTRIRQTGLLVAALLVAVLMAGCGGEVAQVTEPGDDEPQIAADVVPVTGDGQEGAVTEFLDNAITVEVVDSAGNPIEGVLVNFEVRTQGGGQFDAGSLLTGSDGTVSNSWSLGERSTTRYDDSVHVAEVVVSDDGHPNVADTVSAFADAGPHYEGPKDRTQRGAGSWMPDPWALPMEALDRYGNPLPTRILVDSVFVQDSVPEAYELYEGMLLIVDPNLADGEEKDAIVCFESTRGHGMLYYGLAEAQWDEGEQEHRIALTYLNGEMAEKCGA